MSASFCLLGIVLTGRTSSRKFGQSGWYKEVRLPISVQKGRQEADPAETYRRGRAKSREGSVSGRRPNVSRDYGGVDRLSGWIKVGAT